MATKKPGVPKKDGSGKGVRANQGRGDCAKTEKTGKGNNRKVQDINTLQLGMGRSGQVF